MFNQYQPFINYGVPSRFSFSSILNGAQKTLNIVNQALPIVKEVKPIVKNARTLFNVTKSFSKMNNDIPVSNKNEVNNISSNNINDNNGLNFFI